MYLIFVSEDALKLVRFFAVKTVSALFLIAGIYSTTNLQTYEQSKNFFNQANTESSSEESLKLKRRTLISM